MKNKLFRSVRIEIITYVILSLILSLITTMVITFGIFMLRDVIKRDTVKHNLPTEVSNIKNVAGNADTNAAIDKEKNNVGFIETSL